MRRTLLCLAAMSCGNASDEHVDAQARADAAGQATVYRGHVDALPPVPFGKMPATCDYTMTFQQLDVSLTLQNGMPVAGRVQNLNVEKIVGTCQFSPAPDVISNYNFESAKTGASGLEVTFQPDAMNRTIASLVVLLLSKDGAYTARMTFHRTDLGTPFDWTVKADVPLAP